MLSLLITLIYQPLLNLLILIYKTAGLNDLGLAIILMTVAIRLALSPLSLRTVRSQREMAKLAPKLEELKERYKNDTQAQSEAVMALYREHQVNPLAGCLPMLIQFPILIGIYRVFLNIFKPGSLGLLYSFIPHPATINHLFLGFLDISVPSHILAIVAGLTQFIQARMLAVSQPAGSPQAALNTQMTYIFPILIIVISWQLPAGLALYWATTTLFSIGEQLYLRAR